MEDESFWAAAIQPFYPQSASENIEMQESAWRLCEEAAGQGVRLLVLPEYFNIAGIPPEEAGRAIDDSPKVSARAADFCRSHEIWLLLPVVENRDGARFNAAHLFDPSGKVEHTYDKTHLTIGERELYRLEPGKTVSVVETDLGAIGVMICYDVYFPEVAQLLALAGAQLILFPSRQQSDNEESVMLLNRARAMDGACHLIRCGHGLKADEHFAPGKSFGGSCIIGPDGAILATAGRHEGMAIARIDPHRPWTRNRCGGYPAEPVRKFLNEDRRPELYGGLGEFEPPA